jgi:glutaredoxin
MVTVYTTDVCPKCNKLKKYLDSIGVKYKAENMETPEALTELRFAGVFTLEAPVLFSEGEYYLSKQFFKGAELDTESVRKMVGII